MSDIFGYQRNPKADGVFSSEDSSMVIGDSNMTSNAYLVQNWNIAYRQDVQELFEIGSNRLYWAKGRPTGSGSIGRVVGGVGPDTESVGLMPPGAYDICDGGATMTIKATGGHCKNGEAPLKLNKGVKLTMKGVVITSIGFSMNVADVRIMEAYDWRFAHLEIK
jgi:hypothetical protein